jgi:two-component system CheB/CheR fusion protein
MTDQTSAKLPKAAAYDQKGISQKLPIVGIGASAGGLEAFKVFFGKMPVDTGMAFVMVPHLDPGHKSLIAEIIGRHTGMPVIEMEDRMPIKPNHIYLVPPNRNLAIEDSELVPCEISRSRGINLPVDFFFRSLAAAQKERAIGIILSGTMRDGSMGLKDIKEHGGLVIAQAPETAQHDGMPQSAIDTGMVDFVLPIEEMPDAIVKFIAHPYIHGETSAEDQDELNQVLAVIQARTRHDFRCYKRNTLIRRTERRMGLRQIERMADYVHILKRDNKETDALLKDLLIGVTGFFREEQVWEIVGREILPPMINGLESEIPLRVWIPGCSTGEEAYTISILVHDAFEKANRHFNAQIFATDIDAEAITVARSGVYPETIAANIPPEFLNKYFVREDKEYHILRRVRESVVFAAQNLVGDAPFSNLNLISCRNLLIYLNSDVQKKVMELFHFSLREKGCLVLGNSETIGYQHHLFETVSKECRIYRRIGQRDERTQIPTLRFHGRPHSIAVGAQINIPRDSMSKLMRGQLLSRFAPAAVLIDKNFDILNLHGPTSQYLNLPQGDPVMELTAMVKEGLRLKLRAAIHKAMKKKETITVADARVKRDRHYYPVRLTVSPIKEKDLPAPVFLVTFEDLPEQERETDSQVDHDLGEETLARQLEAELIDTREDLQNTIEELETSNEELKASNEEMMSMNEELQSSNEELETSKEELQSMNEELNTVNTELREKVQELERANNDMANLMNSTEVATVFLDVHMAIRQFTPAAKNLFNLIPSDVGRPIGDLAMRFNDDDLNHHTARVMEKLVPSVKEVATDEGQWYIRRIMPFRTQDNRVDGLVLTFVDITEIKQTEVALRESEDKFRHLAESAPDIIARFDARFRYTYVNPVIETITDLPPARFIGKTNRESGLPTALSDLWDAALKNALESGQRQISEFNVNVSGDRRYFEAITVPEIAQDGPVKSLLCIARDITGRKTAEETLQAALAEKEVLLREVHHRVKNNMQVIVGLLRMHTRRIDNTELTQSFDCCRDRIEAMSLIHEALYRSDDLAHIDFEAYLKELCRNLSQSHDASGKGITVVVERCEVSMNMDQGIAVGMVIVELVSNAFKHAFPHHEDGKVSVSMGGLDAGMIELVVADNGKGLPREIDLPNVSTFGLRLAADIVTRELGGRIDVERDGGTRFVIRFDGDHRSAKRECNGSS